MNETLVVQLVCLLIVSLIPSSVRTSAKDGGRTDSYKRSTAPGAQPMGIKVCTTLLRQALPLPGSPVGPGDSLTEANHTEGMSSSEPLWSKALLELVAHGFGMELERPGGVAGCCVPGMWCGPRGCYTLAAGNSFSNHGAYVGMPANEYSVYTCVEPSQPVPPPQNVTSAGDESDQSYVEHGYGSSDGSATLDVSDDPRATEGTSRAPPPAFPRPTILSVDPDVAKAGGALTLVGREFGGDAENVRVMVGGRECRNPELCHLVCRPCGQDDQCAFDEMCIEDGLSNDKVCLPICDMTADSCPCDHVCLPKRFELQGPHSMEVNLCRPPDADPDFLCHGSELREQDRIQCTVPVLEWDQAETEALHGTGLAARSGERHLEADGVPRPPRHQKQDAVATATVSLSVEGRPAVWEAGVAYGPRHCDSARDCNDGDACSLDSCSKRKCVHNGVHEAYGCQAQPSHVTWRGDAYRYFQIVDRADPEEQAEFVAEVQARHKLSGVTHADDFPVERHMWDTEFPIYGTKHKDIFISPNGVLFVSEPQTVVSAEDGSAVSPGTEASLNVLKADWNPHDTWASSSVFFMIEDEQFTVLYEDVFLFKRSASATPSTFSTTIFPDGSLRYRYMRIGDRADWTAGVSGNTFVSPTIRHRHVRQAEVVRMDENGRPSAACTSPSYSCSMHAHSRRRPPPPARDPEHDTSVSLSDDLMSGSSTGASDRSASSSVSRGGAGPMISQGGSPDASDSAVPSSTASSEGRASNTGDAINVSSDSSSRTDSDSGSSIGGGSGTGSSTGGGGGDAGAAGWDYDVNIDATLCRAPTVACLGRACGRAGSQVSVLWEGFNCQAAGPSLNFTFACRFGGVEVPAVRLDEASTSSMAGEVDFDRDVDSWGPDWIGGEDRASEALVCEVPRLDWVEEGVQQAVLVPVEIVWFLPPQASASAQEQVDRSASSIAVRGLSFSESDSIVSSHVLIFSYHREDVEPPNCGCSPAPRRRKMTCDSCLVCGGDGSTKDCGGFCHGEAYKDPCGQCSGGMTGVQGGMWCEESSPYDDPTTEVLVSLSQSIMMLVALTIMTAFLTTCLFLARALMIRGVLTVEGGRPGSIRRRIFSRRRGLSLAEISCLDTVVHYAAVPASSPGGDDVDSGNAKSSVADAVDRGVAESPRAAFADSLAEIRSSGTGADTGGLSLPTDDQCAICLGNFEDADVLRKLPCRHLFHQGCVDEWLGLSVACPLCKRSARDGLLRSRRRRRRARVAAAATAAASVAEPPAPLTPASATPRSSNNTRDVQTPEATTYGRARWMTRLAAHVPRSLGRAGRGGGGGAGRSWVQVAEDEDDVDDDVEDDEKDEHDAESSPARTRAEGRRRAIAAELSEFLDDGDAVGRAGEGRVSSRRNRVVMALEAFFGGRSEGARRRDIGGSGSSDGSGVGVRMYELAPVTSGETNGDPNVAFHTDVV